MSNLKKHIPLSIKEKYFSTIKIFKKIKLKIPFFVPPTRETHQFWTNYPEERIIKIYSSHEGQSEYLFKYLQKNLIDFSVPILEIGTNLGRNLNYLFKKGYKNLHGIEINKKTIDIMKKIYPDLKANILIGPVENEIKKIPNNKFSLTFSMSVLMHLNPRSNSVFKEISRVTKDYIITIEREKSCDPPSVFPRNYHDIFTKLGWKQIHSEIPKPEIFANDKELVMRIFKKS